ncbi:MAG: hypothetical protein ACTSVI_13810 [Promethearchaeota archaeon]
MFEEIAHEIYKIKESMTLMRYLMAVSIITTIYLFTNLLIVLDLQVGIFLGIACSFLAIGNGLIHLIGYMKVWSFFRTIASGVFFQHTTRDYWRDFFNDAITCHLIPWFSGHHLEHGG